MAEPTKRIIVDGVDFTHILYFPRIIAQAASALQPARLVIGLFVVVALVTFGRIWDGLAPPPIHPSGLAAGMTGTFDRATLNQPLAAAVRKYAPTDAQVSPEWELNQALLVIESGYRRLRAETTDEDQLRVIDREYRDLMAFIEASRPKGAFESLVRHVTANLDAVIMGALSLEFASSLEAMEQLLVVTPTALFKQAPWFSGVFGLLFVILFSIGGGALSRMAAAQAATGERITIRHSIDFAAGKWSALVWSQILPPILAAVLCGAVILIGVFFLIPVIDILAGVGYGAALLVGFVLAFLALGYAVGFPMLVPAVACENCDGADAVQRAFAYAVTRPLHLIGYWIVGLIGLALGFVLVALFAKLTLNFTADLVRVFSDNPALSIAGGYGEESGIIDLSHARRTDTGRWHWNWTADAIQFWQSLVVSLVAAWALAYHFGASTIVYLLMRKRCDGQEIDDIWQPGEPTATDLSAVATMIDEP